MSKHVLFQKIVYFCILEMRNREILRLALPSIIQNITVPLLGLVDLTIVGHMGATRYIAAVSVGSMIFNVIYWLLGFLRMGSSGLTSQALGRRDFPAVKGVLLQTILLGLTISLCFIVLQIPLLWVALKLMVPSADGMESTETLAPLVSSYFNICIWGAPAVLCLYGLTGWFIGMQNTRTPMFVAIGQNLMNILLSLVFVYVMGMKIEGVALGTLLAQWGGLLLALFLWRKYYGGRSVMKVTACQMAYRKFFKVNRDIFLRTICLVAVNLFFTMAGSQQGEIMLSVNTLLMTLFMLFSYVMDGFAFAGEALCGKYYGARNAEGFHQTVSGLFRWGALMALMFTLCYVIGGNTFLGLLTNEESVIQAAQPFFWWAVAVPAAGVAAFIYDGVFIGIAESRGMLISCGIAAMAFFIIYFSLFSLYGNHALWIALLAYLFLRGLIQSIYLKKRHVME